MGKYMRKCSREIGEVAVMEVTQVVGVRTRARALALAAAAAQNGARTKRRRVEGGEFRVSYLQLRSRRLILTPGKHRRAAPAVPAEAAGDAASESPATSRLAAAAAAAAAAANSGAGGECASGGREWDRVSRCSSNTSSEVLATAAERASSGSGRPAPEVDDGSETTACNYEGDVHRWRGKTPSDDLESTARPAELGGARRGRGVASAGTTLMPSEAEIEEFFAAAERQEWKRFADKYNFDVVKDVPLQGRYEWVQIKP